MDKASNVLEKLTAPQLQLPVGYQRLSSNSLLVDKEINLDSSLTCLGLPNRYSVQSVPDQPLVS